jgi:lysophospholipase L1-like esterase
MIKHGIFFLIIACLSISIVAQEKIEVTWYDATVLGIEGKGFVDTKTPYDRLPSKAEKTVPEGVWKRSMNSAGMSVTFATDAPMIVVKWRLRNPSISSPYLSSMSVAGLDLYVRESGKWMWAATKAPQRFPDSTHTFLRGLSKELREYKLYLPIYNGVEKVEIGVPKGSKFGKALDTNVKKPIVFYGSSIIQGSASSRPGMTLVAQLSRRLDMPIVNLGFSGLCHMEPALAELLSELDASVFVIDCLPNMKVNEIGERTRPLVKTIRKARPTTPIVIVENPMYSQALWNPAVKRTVDAKNKLLAAEFAKLGKEGIKGLYYVEGETLYGPNGNSTVDGVHPTDLGFTIYADVLEPILRNILTAKTTAVDERSPKNAEVSER